MKKILILGRDGQVGRELVRCLACVGDITALGRAEVRLEDGAALRRAVTARAYDVVINAAAYTQVDQAEKEPELARLVNGTAPGIIAGAASGIGALLVHYSTDFVFAGDSARPYLEGDPAQPLGVYGQSKLEGDHNIQQAPGEHLILRTSWVYGLHGKNFLLTMLRLAGERDVLKVVDDQTGNPTWSRMIAQATTGMLQVIWQRRMLDPGQRVRDLVNLSSSGSTSWHGFASAIMQHLGTSGHPCLKLGRVPAVTAIKSSEHPSLVRRPSYSVLDKTRLEKHYGICMPSWEEQLRLCLA